MYIKSEIIRKMNFENKTPEQIKIGYYEYQIMRCAV